MERAEASERWLHGPERIINNPLLELPLGTYAVSSVSLVPFFIREIASFAYESVRSLVKGFSRCRDELIDAYMLVFTSACNWLNAGPRDSAAKKVSAKVNVAADETNIGT